MRTQPGHPPAANEDASAGGWLTIRAGTPSLPPASRSRPRRDPPVRSRWPHAPGHAGSRRGRSAAPVARPIAPADRQVGPNLGARIRPIEVVLPILAQLSGRRPVAAPEIALPQSPVVQDRDVGLAKRDLRRLDRASQIRPEHGGNAVVAPPSTHLRGVVAATLGEAPGQPAGSDAPFVVLAQHMRLEHDLDRHSTSVAKRPADVATPDEDAQNS